MNKVKDDLIYNLIKTFSSKELTQAQKYLAIFDEPSSVNFPLIIFNQYLELESYNVSVLLEASNCKTLSHFRKEKSILKNRILDFMRNFSVDFERNPFSLWRKKIDHGTILKNQGEMFWSEGISLLRSTIEECYDEASGTYVLAAYEEVQEMFHKIPAKNFKDIQEIVRIEAKTLNLIQEEQRYLEFYNQISIKLVHSAFIKSKESEEKLLQLMQNPLYQTDLSNVYGNANKFMVLMSQLLLAQLNRQNEVNFKSKLDEFSTLYHSFSPHSWYNNSFFKFAYFIGAGNSLLLLQDINSLKTLLTQFKLFLNSFLPSLKSNPIYWARYYHLYYSYLILRKDLSEKHVSELENLVEIFNGILPVKILVNLKSVLIQMYYSLGIYPKAIELCNEIIYLDESSIQHKDLKNITKLVVLALLFKQSLIAKNLNNQIIEIESIASTNYRYFRSQDNNYHQLELLLCSFFKNLSIKQKNDLSASLVKFKGKMEEVREKDPYNFVTKVTNHYFNFYQWIDECIDLV